MQLSKKQKIVSEFLAVFPKSASTFKYFEKKNDTHSLEEDPTNAP